MLGRVPEATTHEPINELFYAPTTGREKDTCRHGNTLCSLQGELAGRVVRSLEVMTNRACRCSFVLHKSIDLKQRLRRSDLAFNKRPQRNTCRSRGMTQDKVKRDKSRGIFERNNKRKEKKDARGLWLPAPLWRLQRGWPLQSVNTSISQAAEVPKVPCFPCCSPRPTQPPRMAHVRARDYRRSLGIHAATGRRDIMLTEIHN